MEAVVSANATLDTNSSLIYTSSSLVGLVPGWIVTGVIVFICIAAIIGIPGNSLVLAVLIRTHPKTSTDWFIISIAICDLISLAVNGTIDIFRYQPKAWARIGTPALCNMHYYIIHALFINSNFLIVFVGIDRYLKTCRPHGSYFTPTRAFWSCIGVTAGSIVCAIPNGFTSTVSPSGTCIFDKEVIQLRVVYTMSLTIVIVTSSILLVLIYSRIAIVLKKRALADKVRRETTRRILQSNDQVQLAFADLHGTLEPARQHKHPPHVGSSTDATLTHDMNLTGTPVNGLHITNAPVHASTSTASYGDSAEANDERNQKVSALNYVRGYIHRKTSKIHPDNTFSNMTQTQSSGRTQSILVEEDEHSKRANKTTKMIFAITLLYIVATVIPTVMAPFLTETNLRKYAAGQALIFLTLRLYTINHFSNPLMYMFMSSIFRRKTLVILKSCKLC